jgi:RNA polymerase nonessential primary-like sigma factor
VNNRKYQDIGIKLRTQYNRLRSLTLAEEQTAGKISHISKRLKAVKKSLISQLHREPTEEEWAGACKMNTTTLNQYLDLSAKARNRLVQHNMRLVDYWVTKILVHSDVARDISYVDLVAEGVVGLTRAAENYNGGSRFGPYATVWIRSELYRGLSRLRPGNLANHRRMMILYRMKKAEYELTEQLQRAPSDEEIAANLHMRVDYLRAIRVAADAKTISVDTAVGGETAADPGSDENTYKDLFLKADQINFSTELMLWKVQFLTALEVLTPTERRTLSLRFGLLDGIPKGVGTTAQLMTTTPEGVRKIIHKSLSKLKTSAFSEFLKDGPPIAPLTTTSGKIGARSY